jgi:hypothetical protein
VIGWSLAAVSVLWGVGAFWVFRRFSDRPALRTVRKRLYAHLLEIRLYSEEPALVWGAQKALIADNFRFLRLTALPLAIMALPFAFLYGPLDSIYGWGPIEPAHSAVVTVQLSRDPGANVSLVTPPGIAVETPPVRDYDERQISWRIRALMPVRGTLRLEISGAPDALRSIVAGRPGLSFHWRRESAPGIVWIEVDYPGTNVAIAGLSLPWLAWFLIISTVSAGLSAAWPRSV